MSDLVSAIVTTYRRREPAKRAVRSVLNQTHQPVELIVVEDGSDELGGWISSHDATERITYVRHDENEGLPAARNTGLETAKGKYVAFLDDDDWWKPTKLDRQLQHYRSLPESERDRTVVVQCGIEVRRPDGSVLETVYPSNEGNLREEILQSGPSTVSSSFLFVSERLRSVGGYDESLLSNIDHDAWMALADADYWASYVEEPLVVTVESPRREGMMNNLETRIKGTNQFLEKWTPVVEDWRDIDEAEAFEERYRVRILSGLVASKVVEVDPGAIKDAFEELVTETHNFGYTANLLLRKTIREILKAYGPSSLWDLLRDNRSDHD